MNVETVGSPWRGVILLAVILLTPGPAASQEMEPPSPAIVERTLAPRLEADGRWRQDNPEWVAGWDDPKYWEQRYAWGPGRDVVILDVHAVFDDNTCTAMTHIVYSLDADGQSVTVDGFGPGGQRATGRLTAIDDTTTRTTLTIRRPDGRELRMRDVTDSSPPDAYVTAGEVWDGSEWVPTDAVEWRRHTGPSPCR